MALAEEQEGEVAEDDACGEGDKDFENGEHDSCMLMVVGDTKGRKNRGKVGVVVNSRRPAQ